MKVNHIATLIAFAGGLALSTSAIAQDAATKPHVPLEKSIGQVKATGPVPSLAVINSAGAKLDGGKLVLTGDRRAHTGGRRMNTQRKFRKYLTAAALITAFLATDSWLGGQFIPQGSIVSSAEARVGRPATPGSVAGVARRTTRRTIRRSAIYVAALPGGCVTTSVNGVTVWRCGGTYYQPYGGRYVVVYID